MKCTTLTPIVKHCAQCGIEFTPAKNRASVQNFCSAPCYTKFYNSSRHESIIFTCKRCGKEYHPKASNRSTFCTRECAFAYRRENPTRREIETPPMPRCQVCGVELPKRMMRTCESPECRAELNRRYYVRKHTNNIQPRTCKICGATFTPVYGDKKRTICSEKCARRNHRLMERKNRKINGGNLNHTMRKRMRLLHGDDWRQWYEPISAKRVYQRDKYRCQLCGRKVIVGGEWHPRQASIDHIVPVSIGGEHKYANVQTCCMECNSRKGATIQGQLRLIG